MLKYSITREHALGEDSPELKALRKLGPYRTPDNFQHDVYDILEKRAPALTQYEHIKAISEALIASGDVIVCKNEEFWDRLVIASELSKTTMEFLAAGLKLRIVMLRETNIIKDFPTESDVMRLIMQMIDRGLVDIQSK
jgi:hypothetical protein